MFFVFFLLPKAEDRQRVDEWKGEQHTSGKQELGCKTQKRHAIHTVTSGTLVKNHNPTQGAENAMEVDWNVLLLSLSVASQASDHFLSISSFSG